jgi:hypothetical protein
VKITSSSHGSAILQAAQALFGAVEYVPCSLRYVDKCVLTRHLPSSVLGNLITEVISISSNYQASFINNLLGLLKQYTCTTVFVKLNFVHTLASLGLNSKTAAAAAGKIVKW